MVETEQDPLRRDSRPRLSRRRFLATTGVFAGLAGCSSSGEDDATETSTPTFVSTQDVDIVTPTATPSPTEQPSLPQGISWPSPSSQFAPTDGFAVLDAGVTDRSIEVVKVTTLAGSGEGSLRSAVTGSSSGPRLVVFEVGGVIDLEGKNLDVTVSDLFIAGQTAPSPGITVIKGGFMVDAENVIVQHLRVRPGDDLEPLEGSEGGAVDAMGVSDEARNVIYDHCSASWGSDETMSCGGGSVVTFSNNIIAEGLHDSIHPDGAHSMGTLVLQPSKRVTIVGNLWAHNNGRHPRLKGGTTSAVVNNVAYNFGRAITVGGDGETSMETSIVGNLYRAGPNTNHGRPIIEVDGDARSPSVYLEDNRTEPEDLSMYPITELYPVDEKPVWPDGLTAIPSAEVLEHTLSTAGARPAERTPHDERIVSDVREGTGGRIDSQSDVGGYPELERTTRTLDVPDDDLKGWLSQHTKAVELPDAEPP